MKKHFTAILCSLILMCWATGASAVPTTINYAFTADNQSSSVGDVVGFSLFGTSEPTPVLNKTDSWWTASHSDFKVDLTPGQTYTLQWLVQNQGGVPSNSNPMAFLGQFTVFGTTYLSGATSPWQINGVAPTAYGALGADNIWEDNGSNDLTKSNLTSWINPTAQWIGLGAYPGTANSMIVTAKFTAPVPIPGAALLLGSGLLGLIGVRRKQLV